MHATTLSQAILRAGAALATTCLVLASDAAPAPAPSPVTTNSVGLRMVMLPAGSFDIGSDTGDWDERPVHHVTLSRPLTISASEVTLEAFRRFRPDHDIGTNGKATGVSWDDAVVFCAWLSRRESKPYRLPTEAEWEYACRTAAGPDLAVPATTGKTARLEQADNLAFAFSEGPCHVYSKRFDAGTVALGGNDRKTTGNKSHYIVLVAPEKEGCEVDLRELSSGKKPDLRQARLGAKVYMDRGYAITRLDETLAGARLVATSNDDDYGTARRHVAMTVSTPVTVYLAFMANCTHLLPAWMSGFRAHGSEAAKVPALQPAESATAEGVRPVRLRGMRDEVLEWCHDWHGPYRAGDQVDPVGPDAGMVRVVRGGKPDDDGRVLPGRKARHYQRAANRAALPPAFGPAGDENPNGHGRHRVGFRIVQGPMPGTKPYPAAVPHFRLGVKHTTAEAARQCRPDAERPYFRKRYVLPTPPETGNNESLREAIDAAGLHPAFRGHNHSPGLEVLPNGDVLLVIYTSWREYEPGVSFIAARLRFGADRWDRPSYAFDIVDANDHAPLLWTDGRTTYLFWGSPRLQHGAYPFQWTATSDSGATWSPVRFPRFTNKVGPHSRQPINSAFHDKNGTVYLASDGHGGSSVLWVGKPDMTAWRDPGGRTHGRHTTACLLSDGTTLLGMGGKNTHIDGYMPKSVSSDGGSTWEKATTPFCWQGFNQRPSLLRLASGRFFFAGDFQCTKGKEPRAIARRGAYAALSDDDGRTWRIKPLPGDQPHEGGRMNGAGTLGYSAARQGPNGLIHLITTMNRPCLHFVMNEAWILADTDTPDDDAILMANAATAVRDVVAQEEKYENGRVRVRWHAGVGDDGRYLLHGKEQWYFPDGTLRYEATYERGEKVGMETRYRTDGSKVWQWDHRPDGTSTWTQWWPNGTKKAASTWKDFHAVGPARTWDRAGRAVLEKQFPDR